MFVLEGRTLSLDVPFEHNGIQYPANWLRLSTPEEREAIGITEELDPAAYDQRFWWSPGVPKDHSQLVDQWVAQTRVTAGTLLAPTDWLIIREADNGTAIPAEVKAARQDIRELSRTKVAAITATQDTEELASYLTSADYNTWEKPEPVRARNDDGTFKSDDPTTPDINEAWA